MRISSCWCGLFALLPGLALAGGPDTKDTEFFEAKVRPILVQRCYECHSDQSKTLRGNLRLDSKAGWEKGGDLGPAIEPGNPDDSTLVQAVRWDDEALRMPPKGKLAADEVAILTDWVQRGAPDPRTGPITAMAKKARVIDHAEGRKHWSFQPLNTAAPPSVKDNAWCRTPIDQFILAKLEAKGLKPSPPAEPAKLLRRMHFDLTGLPPTPAMLDAFADPQTRDTAATIDSLLASPHYGERWARHWLDLARYAESHGFEHDYDRPTAYPYRDFVIEAFNRDLPYDTFVKWQLAGDELAPNDPFAAQATGFLAAGVHSTQITASQAEKERYDELDDMLATTGTAFLGLTLGCARCHDHKFDPITNLEYYRMLSTFTTTVRSEVDLDHDPEGYRVAKAAYDRAHAPYLEALAAVEREDLPANLERWEQSRAQTPGSFPWLVLELLEHKSTGGATLTKLADGSVLASGTNPDHETLRFTAHVPNSAITAVRVEALSDPSLVRGGPGRGPNGNFALTDFLLSAKPLDDKGKPVEVKLKNARATYEQAGLPAAAAIDADGTSGWAVDPQFGRDHAAVFEVASPISFQGGAELIFTLKFTNNLKHGIGRVRLAVTTTSGTVALDAASIPQAIDPILATPRAERRTGQTAALLGWFRTVDPAWEALKKVERRHARNAPKPAIVKTLISTEGLPAVRLHTQGPDFYEKTFMLRRGDPGQKVEEVTPGVLAVLSSESESESVSQWRPEPPKGARTSFRRAAMAEWMTDVDDGAGALLARVIVNRLWQHHFGRGLVATPSDFGLQGERPSHPELLDWLANRLIQEGWGLKAIHKLIMTSSVYQQGSHLDPEKAKLDVDNALWWRQDRRRLEAEVIRDAMLAVSGLLDESLYGPGTLDETMRRRSIYFQVKRSRMVPMMTLFDAPDALVPIAVRSETTVAPQSLFLMNNPQLRSWAEAFAARIAPRPGQSIDESVRLAYRLALGRQPDDRERADALAFLIDAQERGDRATALADFCQVLLGTNELIFIE